MSRDLIIDVDDTVANIRDLVAYACSQESGRNIHWKDWSTYQWEDIYGELDFVDLMLRWKVAERAMPDGDLWYQVVIHAKKMGWNVTFITARAWHPNAKDVTENWLLENGIGFDEVVIVEHSFPKINLILDRYDPVWIIEDSPHNLNDLLASPFGDRVIKMQRPWNVGIPHHCNADNAYDVLRIMGAV